MEKEFIPYEEALALKELGFDESCIAEFYVSSTNHYELHVGFPVNHHTNIKAPLYQQVFRWFEKEYGYIGWVKRSYHSNIGEYFIPFVQDKELGERSFPKSDTYEEAELACLRKLIEIVKEKK